MLKRDISPRFAMWGAVAGLGELRKKYPPGQSTDKLLGTILNLDMRFQSVGCRNTLLAWVAVWALALSMASSAAELSPFAMSDDLPASASKVNLAVGARFPIVKPDSANPTDLPDSGVLFLDGSNAMSTLDDNHELSVGDNLSFQILEDKDDSKQMVVTDSGEVELPYLGRYMVKGMTCKRLALELKKELEAKYYYHATVIISVDSMSRNIGNVYLSGALRTPGRLGIPGNEVFTLSKAVLCAGGFTDTADKHNVKVTRRAESGGTNEFFTVDVGQILEKGRIDMDLPLKPGDMIFVPERLVIF